MDTFDRIQREQAEQMSVRGRPNLVPRRFEIAFGACVNLKMRQYPRAILG
jgi:hypothetical protein